MKLFSNFILCFFLFSAALYGNAKGTALQFKDVKITNAVWNTPDDGSAPKLLKYDVTIKTDHFITLKGTINNPTDLPLSSFHTGDIVYIAEEAFFLDNPSQSHYLIVNFKEGTRFVLSGESLSEPSYDYDGAYPIVNIKKSVEKDKSKNALEVIKFSIKGYRFTIDNNDFSGLYKDGAVVISEEREIINTLSNNKQVLIKGYFKHNEEEFSFLSDPFTTNDFVDDPDWIQVLHIKEVYKLSSLLENYGDERLWKIERIITLFTTRGNFNIGYSNTAWEWIPDCCLRQKAPVDNNDYNPMEHKEFVSNLAIGQQIVILEGDRLLDPKSGVEVTHRERDQPIFVD